MPPIAIPSNLVESLGCKSPHDALLALADESESTALKLAEELAASLSTTKKHSAATGSHNNSSSAGSGRRSKREDPAVSFTGGQFVPLPRSLRDAPRPTRKISQKGSSGSSITDHETITNSSSSASHALTHATLASESILSSLSKIASGGSAASSEMRQLESHRQRLDEEAINIDHALRIREGCQRGGDSLMGRRYGDAARAVADVNSILKECSMNALQLAGEEALEAHSKTKEVTKRAIGERYETAVANGDVVQLSELTPLLQMLDMAELGVRLYLQYSQSVLTKEMNLDTEEVPVDMAHVERAEGMSRAAMRRRAEEEQLLRRNMSVPMKLARIYNAAVTHLRHHLPMVAYALGEADGDAALVQLVHVEAEKRAVDILRDYMSEKQLNLTVRRADGVGKKIEDRYIGGGFSARDDEINIANVLGFAGDALGGGGGSGGGTIDIVTKRMAAQKDDCGFQIEVGNLADVDAALEEWALVMQHTESYERFIRHAVNEVVKARKLRREQKIEEKNRLKELEEAKSREHGSDMTGSGRKSSERLSSGDVDVDQEEKVEILPPHTALNEVAAEIGGSYSALERCLLLAGMQRAFVHANYPDDSTFSPVVLDGSSNSLYGAGSRALQTNLVEECLFAARRSTLRAFATGHTGTASAAANVCVDVLGRLLLDVLIRRAELGASLLKPGEGLLDGQSGLGQAALSFAKSKAGKGLRGVHGAGARSGHRVGDEELRKQTMLGVARATANFNDLEVVADYTKRLEGNFLKEIDSGYPRGHDTEQLRMCVKGLKGVVESFTQASGRSMEQLISTLLPQVRQIVGDAVGQDGGGTSATASNFLGSPVLAGGATIAPTVLNYELDDESFEMSQISEGFVVRMCSRLDELIDPLRVHLVPKLSDDLLVGILGGMAKRMEASIRKSKFTPLGAISLDSDVRYIMNFAKDRIDSPQLKSNVTLCKICPPLARLNQIALLMNVDDLEDVLDLISVSKRKGVWDLKLDEAKTLLSLRVDFEGEKVNDLLQMDDE
mmetsp:Transcript_25352/g.38939  ORF Transcript_25352/g.38939 Transcript_25352/m.38939 type:complete len:1017 (-) Transcript_25352:72-3122(-)